MCVRSCTRSHRTNVSSARCWSSSSRAASGGSARRVVSDGRPHHAAEPRGLPVGEDRAPREGGHLAHGDGLREEHRRVGVVAGREVEERDRDEQGVAELRRLEVGDEVGPAHPQQHRLDAPVGAAVLGVHREDDQVDQPVDALRLGPERDQGVEEVGHLEPAVGPPLEVLADGGEVLLVVRERGDERGDGRVDRRPPAPGPGRAATASVIDPSLTCSRCSSETSALSRCQAGCVDERVARSPHPRSPAARPSTPRSGARSGRADERVDAEGEQGRTVLVPGAGRDDRTALAEPQQRDRGASDRRGRRAPAA